MTEQERMARPLAEADPEIDALIRKETERQNSRLELIASENFTSEAVLEAAGSIFTNKYAEGYPGRRYYGGCEYADVRRKPGARPRQEAVSAPNTPTCSRIPARRRIRPRMRRVLNPGDTILGMNLSHGGHLTHGHHLNFSGKTLQDRALRRAPRRRAHRLRRARAPGRGAQARK